MNSSAAVPSLLSSLVLQCAKTSGTCKIDMVVRHELKNIHIMKIQSGARFRRHQWQSAPGAVRAQMPARINAYDHPVLLAPPCRGCLPWR